ncbi:hypothetical protein Naga_100013g33 [Nannochloropsis gaditana]|uniref:Uncharacterized protein n=1 Tax=Nannochloropsis gaditana TaxID=72520 RepID=W7TWR7_9STRA|nr:hypothetical protein Naga_100013g33 [Nannochloropsis gaditana]
MAARQLFLLALLPAVALSFMGHPRVSRGSVRMMSDLMDKPKISPAVSTPPAGGEPKSTALVPVNPQTIETSAAIVGTSAGIVFLGPVLGIVLGLLTNYAAKTDNDVGEAARGVGKTALEVFNYIVKINSKYQIGTKVSNSASSLVSKLKENDGEDSVVAKLEETFESTKTKLSDLDQEYDLVSKAKSAVGLTVDFSNSAIDKALELNEKYSIVDKTTDAVKKAVNKAKESI